MADFPSGVTFHKTKAADLPAAFAALQGARPSATAGIEIHMQPNSSDYY
jgi:hypothetical protein